MIIISLVILTIYGILIVAFILGFDKVAIFKHLGLKPKTGFSIVIPFRNEAGNLDLLLKSLTKLNYPLSLFEIIFVDDESEDDSVYLIENFLDKSQIDFKIIKNIRISHAPKKDAITSAIGITSFEWIITTDADCLVPINWLHIIDAFIQDKDPVCVVGPVTYNAPKSFLDRFQFLDFLSLQASTIAGFGIKRPFLCNGANLSYNKHAFFEVNGFKGNDHVASGDDIFLCEKLAATYPKKVKFLNSLEAVVRTRPVSDLKNLLSQRIRWAAKTTAYKNTFAKFAGITVLLMNSLLVITFFLSFLNFFNWQLLILMVTIKLVLDYILIKKVSVLYKQPISLLDYLLSGLLYPFFSMFVAISSLNSTYSWKGRTFKK